MYCDYKLGTYGDLLIPINVLIELNVLIVDVLIHKCIAQHIVDSPICQRSFDVSQFVVQCHALFLSCCFRFTL